MRPTRLAPAVVVVALLAMASTRSDGAADEGRFPSLSGATEWINSKPLTATGLRGRVVLVEFWTYSCINWQRANPYVQAWAAKYTAQGLVVIGVHSPEFEFEKKSDNVRTAVRDFDLRYPIVVDSRHAIWEAFGNNYWPALYFIDSRGRIRHHHYGEGSYDQSERMLQQLLAEAGGVDIDQALVTVSPKGGQRAADWSNLRSPETYLGQLRTERFSSPGGLKRGLKDDYARPAVLKLNQWALVGAWRADSEKVTATGAGARVTYRFHARDLHLVMGAQTSSGSVRYRVSIDGNAPGAAHGDDINEQGEGSLANHRLYQLIRQSMPVQEHLVEIEFLDAGAEVFAFTFS